MERFCGNTAIMARAEYGNPDWVLFRPSKHCMLGDIHTRSGRTGRTFLIQIISHYMSGLYAQSTERAVGSVMAIL